MKILKGIGIGLILLLFGIQFFHTKKNISADYTNDISKIFPVPDSIALILKNSCNDCHSNYTEYPWYSKIQPIDWWLQNHINDGKRSLNFSRFSEYRIYRQYDKLEEITKLLKEDEMPLPSYLLIHRNSKLNEAQKIQLSLWAQSLCHSLEAKYPKDSLVNPKKNKGY